MTVASGNWRVSEAPAVWNPGGDLPDLNVWLALLGRRHPFHERARQYVEESLATGERIVPLYFCRATMLGLIRLLCQPKVMGDAVQTLPGAHALYRQLRDTAGVGFQHDLESADILLASWLGTAGKPLPSRLWTDAWLAALAESSGLRLVSFDRDFRRFPLARSLLLTAS